MCDYFDRINSVFSVFRSIYIILSNWSGELFFVLTLDICGGTFVSHICIPAIWCNMVKVTNVCFCCLCIECNSNELYFLAIAAFCWFSDFPQNILLFSDFCKPASQIAISKTVSWIEKITTYLFYVSQKVRCSHTMPQIFFRHPFSCILCNTLEFCACLNLNHSSTVDLQCKVCIFLIIMVILIVCFD